jgi:hypothetical protein
VVEKSGPLTVSALEKIKFISIHFQTRGQTHED